MTFEVQIFSRTNPEIFVSVLVDANTTCIEAISSSGLCPRDGTLYHAWDNNEMIIDSELASKYKKIFLAPFAQIRNIVCQKKFRISKEISLGYAIFEDCTIFVPGLKVGESATIVISDKWNSPNQSVNSDANVTCFAYKVDLLGEPYKLGDLVFLIPRNSQGQPNQKLFNPITGNHDLNFQLDWKRNKNYYNNICCILKIISINPLKCVFVKETDYIPRNKRKIKKNKKKIRG